MSAAEQEYDICAAVGCQRFPVALWEATMHTSGMTVTADVPLCRSHDAGAADWRRRAINSGTPPVRFIRVSDL